MRFRTYERLLAEASVDGTFAGRLLANPRCAAIDAGYDKLLAESLVGIQAQTLEQFADAVSRRACGRPPQDGSWGAAEYEAGTEPIRLVGTRPVCAWRSGEYVGALHHGSTSATTWPSGRSQGAERASRTVPIRR